MWESRHLCLVISGFWQPSSGTVRSRFSSSSSQISHFRGSVPSAGHPKLPLPPNQGTSCHHATADAGEGAAPHGLTNLRLTRRCNILRLDSPGDTTQGQLAEPDRRTSGGTPVLHPAHPSCCWVLTGLSPMLPVLGLPLSWVVTVTPQPAPSSEEPRYLEGSTTCSGPSPKSEPQQAPWKALPMLGLDAWHCSGLKVPSACSSCVILQERPGAAA